MKTWIDLELPPSTN